ncbi:MAG: cytochrome P450 [Deltaproteobacteria bacterium]|nr:cytochrome P450 [Deltaproteobacteria bacterium]MBI3387955.1 cytochrome P450 [Deltaproteobacteria bacterium]
MELHATTTEADDPWLGCNPLDPEFRDDPHPRLHRLRALDPVNETPVGWRLTRYDDIWRMLHQAPAGVRTTAGDLPGPSINIVSGPGQFILQQDPPDHTRLRRLMSRAFTPRAIENLRPQVRAIVARQLDAVAARGEMDVIADLALPVPSTVICEMMGVPLADRDRFTVWTGQATYSLAAGLAPPDVIDRAIAAATALREYFITLIAARRRNLTDDILSELIRAEEAGDRLSGDELIAQSIGLLIAGFETTIGLIGNGVRALIQHPDELAKLHARPELVASAVEECLRYDGPIVLTVRVTHEDVEMGGKTIPKDSRVFAMIAAANRDPAQFPDPDRFDIERTPNEHLAFGGGAHFCLGAHLARLEAQVAIGGLVERFRGLRLLSQRVEWGPSLFRVPGRLPIALRARSRQ